MFTVEWKALFPLMVCDNKLVIFFPHPSSQTHRLKMAALDGAETQNTTIGSSIIAEKTIKLIPTLLVINYFNVLSGRTS